ncbi:MAG TPA: cell division protein FtsQ/DivIB [Xanthobacteraceae bacterium]|nr:cell division protein FtsQ/DivIB [Xanthobacteraceae bacterium]
MDDRGCLAQPLTWIARVCSRLSARAGELRAANAKQVRSRSRVARNLDRWSSFLEVKWPRGSGIAASGLIIIASIAYGSLRGDHVPRILEGLRDARDGIANAAGFRVVSVALSGNHHVSREEVLASAGITGTTSLPFLDVEQVREHLKTNPWIADATVLKLYPGELQIGLKEREEFALWQKDGRVSVIADDGTVLEPYVAPRMARLPLLVGHGAHKKAKELLTLLDRYPTMRDFVHASVLVGERRWNLRLKNGMDVRLPESDTAAALERLVALDREKNLITRDIVTIDLRLPDRVTVRLSEAAAQARIEALKAKKKGGSA